ncbi:MAG: cysteine desulfurase family protein [Patescibacteria group bacterium]|nr:cysteine desulfurase family protein [Patescibacteria group bacterium]
MRKVYLDYAATTPTDQRVIRTMFPFFNQKFGNASSLHSFGQEAKRAVDDSRNKIAQTLKCKEEEIIFTSGATESNNLAIKGVFKALSDKFKKDVKGKFHFITTQIEHPCILESFDALKQIFPRKISVTYLPVNKYGLIDLKQLEKSIQNNTVLVSIMFVNNEIGTVQPIKEIGSMLKKIARRRSHGDLPLYFHSDATQALSYFDCNLQKLSLDLLTFSGHKIYGPKGVGALVAREGIFLQAILQGGEHEWGKRSGTLNVPGIVGLGEAVKIAHQERSSIIKSVQNLRDYFIKKVTQEIKGIKLNGSLEQRAPNNANFNFKGIKGESLLTLLDQKGIAVSTGSACSSGKIQSSYVQLAIGNTTAEAHSSVRFTMGKYLTKEDINYTVKELKKAVDKLRGISGEL